MLQIPVGQSVSKITAFLHFFDLHFLELKKAHLYEKKIIMRESRLAMRFSLLLADKILIPASSFFESDICKTAVQEFRDIFDYGIIWLVGNGANVEEFAYNKLRQYDVKSDQHKRYSKISVSETPPFLTRHNSATRDIKRDWIDHLYLGSIRSNISDGTCFVPARDFEKRWENIPTDLEEKAFIVKYVAPMLLGRELHPTIINRLHYIINQSYFLSYVNEFNACTMADLVWLASPHPVPSVGPPIPYKQLLEKSRKANLLNEVAGRDPISLLTLKNDLRWVTCVNSAIHQHFVEDLHRKTIYHKEIQMQILRSFIVHGRDDKAKLELKDYLQNTLKLPEPIILHQQPNKGRTVIEKFEECSENIDVAFILLSPDDIGGLSEETLKERARQNVIFELGFFIGKFGRRSGRVILLHKEPLEIPTDLVGIIYIDISAGIEVSGEKIRKELQALTRRTR